MKRQSKNQLSLFEKPPAPIRTEVYKVLEGTPDEFLIEAKIQGKHVLSAEVLPNPEPGFNFDDWLDQVEFELGGAREWDFPSS